MLPPATAPADAFTRDYRPEQQLLIGRWLRPVSLAEAQACYADLLSAAVAQQPCRHWLLDIRRRGIGDEELYAWMNEVYTPRLAATIGQPVYLAYFAMVTHADATVHPTRARNVQQGTLKGTHFHYFNQEADCLSWLGRQP